MAFLYLPLLVSSTLEWKSQTLLATLLKNTREMIWRPRTEERSRDNRNRHGKQEHGEVFLVIASTVFVEVIFCMHRMFSRIFLIKLGKISHKGQRISQQVLYFICFLLNLKNYFFFNLKTHKNNLLVTVINLCIYQYIWRSRILV